MNRSRRYGVFIAVAVLFLLLLAGACQRWVATETTDGSAGDAITGSAPTLIATQSEVVVPLVPGDSPQMLRGTFRNTGPHAVHVTSVTASLAGVSGNRGPCSTDDYLLRDPVMRVDREIGVGQRVDGWSGATIQMVQDPDNNQNGCKLATLEIAYVIA